jgi:hypothetical protein
VGVGVAATGWFAFVITRVGCVAVVGRGRNGGF